MTQQLDGIKLSSTTGYNTLKAASFVGWDRQYPRLPFNYVLPNGTTGTANLTVLLTGTNVDNYDLSQEIRVESSNDLPLEWIVGGSFHQFRSKLESPFVIDSGPLPTNAHVTCLGDVIYSYALHDVGDTLYASDLTARVTIATKKTRTFAGFGAVQHTFADALTARAELRYAFERKKLIQTYPVQSNTAKTFGYWTPRFTVDYKPSDSMMIYASVARGAKSGGFNSAAPTQAELAFGPEFNWTYEVGLKSSMFDKKLQLNLSVFNVEMTGIQITNPSANNPTSFITQNAGTGRSRGFEIELLGRPTPGLTLQATYSLADAKFKKAADGSLRSYPAFLNDYDVSGNPLPRQAKDLGNGYIRFDVRYEGRKNGFTTPLLGYVKARTVVNAHWHRQRPDGSIVLGSQSA